MVTVNAKGKITQRDKKQARYQTEDLGNGLLLEMVSIAGGTFTMGSTKSDSEKPPHSVTVQPFYMGKYPVTQAQWEAVMGNNPSNFKGTNRPVEQVSWDDANEFCQRLSKKTGKSYGLLRSAQWEYACRAGTTTPFYFGETITTELANYDGNYTYGSGPKGEYREQTTEVGNFPPNSFGLYDMHGNVWEWCADPWHTNYDDAPTDGSIWTEGGEDPKRLLRGGLWGSHLGNCRCAARINPPSDYRNNDIGFRLVVFGAAWT
ncbi:Sulphatase-modifying factor protein [Candidatus Thiomargarita nelsonii]|uniref:Sulphatase-modifying factor protein n=1 Tax=Candidatus Thiomargarita nelsonii TaxID=1003181 RepID=A0A4E0QMI0_9GAMM|nr:Sulphatase-modifying factor protein [Candidatus Thiomargarita nelsonii]